MVARIVDWPSLLKDIQEKGEEELVRLEDLAESLMCPKCGSKETRSPLGNDIICLGCDYTDHWSKFCHSEVQKLIDDAENALILKEALE